MQGAGFRFKGLRFRMQDLQFRGESLGFRVTNKEFLGLWLSVLEGLGFKVLKGRVLGFEFWGPGFRVQG